MKTRTEPVILALLVILSLGVINTNAAEMIDSAQGAEAVSQATGTDKDNFLGGNQWGLGPTMVVLKQEGHLPTASSSTTSGTSGGRMAGQR